MNKAQALQELYRMYKCGAILDLKVQEAISFAIKELSGSSGELPPKVRAALDEVERHTEQMMKMRGQASPEPFGLDVYTDKEE